MKSNAVAVLKEVKEGGSGEEPLLEQAEVEESNDLEQRREFVHEAIVHEDLNDQREIVHTAIIHVEAIPACTKNLLAHLPLEDDITTIESQTVLFESRGPVIQAERLTPENDISIEDLE